MSNDVDKILEKLAKDIELAVHALYRGEMRSETAKVRTGHLIQAAKDALSAAIGGGGSAPSPRVSGVVAAMPEGIPQMAPPRTLTVRPSVVAPAVVSPSGAGDSPGWSQEESDAVLRCINAWLPMGGPSSTAPETKCIAAGKMLVPSWGERTKALDAVRRTSTL